MGVTAVPGQSAGRRLRPPAVALGHSMRLLAGCDALGSLVARPAGDGGRLAECSYVLDPMRRWVMPTDPCASQVCGAVPGGLGSGRGGRPPGSLRGGRAAGGRRGQARVPVG